MSSSPLKSGTQIGERAEFPAAQPLTSETIGIQRHFTVSGVDPFESVEWESRDTRITNFLDGSVAFEQKDTEFPASWSLNASNIVAQKYFRGQSGTDEREHSLRQIISRVADTITEWGFTDGYFADRAEAQTFRDELVHLLLHQKASFNSPVWFNIGVKGVPQQSSACFILSVDDTMESILNWYAEEGMIFKGGSGSGVNLSKLRSSHERLSGGGTPSGPVSFMRGADASAGAIKSGGKTRRAAKMVVLDSDHPDIEEFIWCKAKEERKARALGAAGFDVDLDGADSASIQYQNANNSVRLSDEFMGALLEGADWELTSRTTGEIIRTLPAKELFRQIAAAAWECADPGVQFSSTINRWHTASNTGPINASNPCSEYLHLDNSACNLASLNLLSFYDDEQGFDVASFRAAVQVLICAQEILVGRSDYPTEPVGETARAFRQLGLGYANLGALLMAKGVAYDSDTGRALAAAITALMTGQAYLTSAKMASRLGPHSGFEENRRPMLGVLAMHRQSVDNIDRHLAPVAIVSEAKAVWEEVAELAEEVGVRNAQVSVLAPTGTISFMMDCDTTGIEPDLSLVKTKKLVGGGTMTIINQTVPRALRALGYSEKEIDEVTEHIREHNTIRNAPHIRAEHHEVFACSFGEDAIGPNGHIDMMAAVQPFLSGGISKTVNLPEATTTEDIEHLLLRAWEKGVKAVAIYRENCKVAQPLSAGGSAGASEGVSAGGSGGAAGLAESLVGGTGTTGGLAGKSGGVGGARKASREVGAEVDAGQVLGETGQVLVGSGAGESSSSVGEGEAGGIEGEAGGLNRPVRKRLPKTRASRTFEFSVGDCKGFVTVGEYDSDTPGKRGKPGEIFVNVSKQGSTLAGIMDAFAIAVSHGLQYGVPLEAYVDAFKGMRFEPAGITDDPDIRLASSLMDYLFRKLALEYLDEDRRHDLRIYTASERSQLTLPEMEEVEHEARAETFTEVVSGRTDPGPRDRELFMRGSYDKNAPLCMQCGVLMLRAGSCHACPSCGNTSGCS